MADAGDADSDFCFATVVVERGGEGAVLVQECVGIPIECATIVLDFRQRPLTVVRVIEVIGHKDTMIDDAAVAVSIAHAHIVDGLEVERHISTPRSSVNRPVLIAQLKVSVKPDFVLTFQFGVTLYLKVAAP